MVIVPEELEVLDTTFLFITGSDNTMDWDEDETSDKIEMASHIAVNNRMVAASLFQVQRMVMSSYLALAINRQCCLDMRVLSLKVPNQPIVYSDDPLQMERREDESIGWTWFIQFTLSSVKIFLMDNWTCFVYGPGAVQYFFSVLSF